MRRSIYFCFVLGMLFMLQSCTQDNGQDAPDNLKAPTIPSISLFTIPTQSFGYASDDKSIQTRNDKSNWVHAGVNVLVWNTVVFVNTSIPIAAFGHAFDYDATYIGDMTWEWTYEYQSPPNHGAVKYDVSLTGKYISNLEEVAWTMTVTEQASGNSFVWYEGTIATDHTGGEFTVNKDPQNPQPYMNITFTHKSDTEDGTIRFSNVTANAPGFGDYIEWRNQSDATYDRAYDVLTNNDLLEIQVNSVSEIGRVKHSSHFNDDNWHCWDENKFNIEC